MVWEYWVEEMSATASKDDIEEKLSELGSGGWEAVASWAVPGDQHVNKGAWTVHVIFKKPK